LITNKSRFLLCHSSSGHKHALQEVLAQESVQKQLADTQAAAETQALERFCEMLQTEPDRAYYGFNHVLRANEANAIEALLVSTRTRSCPSLTRVCGSLCQLMSD
jgi:protein pelota